MFPLLHGAVRTRRRVVTLCLLSIASVIIISHNMTPPYSRIASKEETANATSRKVTRARKDESPLHVEPRVPNPVPKLSKPIIADEKRKLEQISNATSAIHDFRVMATTMEAPHHLQNVSLEDIHREPIAATRYITLRDYGIGRSGNRLFRYAALRGLAALSGKTAILYRRHPVASLMVNIFQPSHDILTENKTLLNRTYHVVRQELTCYEEEVVRLAKETDGDVQLDGYFQSFR